MEYTQEEVRDIRIQAEKGLARVILLKLAARSWYAVTDDPVSRKQIQDNFHYFVPFITPGDEQVCIWFDHEFNYHCAKAS